MHPLHINKRLPLLGLNCLFWESVIWGLTGYELHVWSILFLLASDKDIWSCPIHLTIHMEYIIDFKQVRVWICHYLYEYIGWK